MSVERLESLDRLVARGWDLVVTPREGKFHASVFLSGRHAYDSYHHIGTTIVDALAALDNYVHMQDLP